MAKMLMRFHNVSDEDLDVELFGYDLIIAKVRCSKSNLFFLVEELNNLGLKSNVANCDFQVNPGVNFEDLEIHLNYVLNAVNDGQVLMLDGLLNIFGANNILKYTQLKMILLSDQVN